jgi:hypothetical protein
MNIGKEIGSLFSKGIKTTARFGGSVLEQSSSNLDTTVKNTQSTIHNKINQSSMSSAGKVASHIGAGIVGGGTRLVLGFTKIIGNAVKDQIGKK